MANISRSFTAGRMNKSVDERLVPDGEYIDALNCRVGSSEANSDMGVIENALGNSLVVELKYNNQTLSSSARTIGAYEDGANETLYWFVHDPNYGGSVTSKIDLIVSYNIQSGILTYHIVSVNDGSDTLTTLNFNPSYLITGVDLVDAGDEGLLFWTDDYNPPRFINIKRGYGLPVNGVDTFSAEAILVIKRPPAEAPAVQSISTGGQQNFLKERFICFAYRYRYADGEYSATSQFSEPAFTPHPFLFSSSSYLNEGMVNVSNAAIITYNTGGPLVKGIDLLFKEAGSNTIKLIEKIDKVKMGLANNATLQYTFTNSKIFTVLPDSELLRLYDNVPLLAKAQTIMGNRLMYGNYIEGYDLKDSFNNDIFISYVASLDSKVLDAETLVDGTDSASYTIGPSPYQYTQAALTIDLSTVSDALVSGAQISISLRFTHHWFAGSQPPPTEETQSVDISWTFTLLSDYDSVYEMVTSTAFLDAVGTVDNIKPIYAPNEDTSCDGFTLTDIYNCAFPNNLSGITEVTKYQSGIDVPNEPIRIIATPNSDIVKFVFPAINYVGDVENPTNYSVYEYYRISYGEALWSGLGIPKSLHSNRGYEVGIVYMDEFGRSSTALVSEDNTVHVPCSYAERQNKILVTIPTTQRAPWWASRYKFVLKADRENYETIYSNVFFRDPSTNLAYILLDGENARKVEVGDRLIVKADSSGPAQNCKYITVLEKEEKAQGFLEIPSESDPEVMVNVPGGVYMKINTNNISITQEENAYISEKVEYEEKEKNEHPVVLLPVNYKDSTGLWVDYTIPSNSRIRLNFVFTRRGSGDGNNNCERRIYTLDRNYISSADYDNFADWWVGDNIADTLDLGTQEVGAGGGPINNEFLPGTFNLYADPGYGGSLTDQARFQLSPQIGTNKYKFGRTISTDPTKENQLLLCVSGTRTCSSIPKKNRASVSLEIEIFRADSTLIFETEPQDTLPDVFFENNKSFPISNGAHIGNVQDQDFASNQPAIVNTEFYNCYTFGNGVESYKVRDSIVGKTFNLGNRVTSVSAQEFKKEDRYADITYSGIYNDESNINRLNEFNSGLLNYKNLENSFGAITILDGRETDILVLQEDKISYVLAGKNLLSDAAAGSAITSVPEVLGTQLARIEDFGNSFNPESYVRWGESKFFTDAKRGAVIQLIGQSHTNEQLVVISEAGMRSWFRDTFVDSLNKQKLGGYDPFTTEYVLSGNDIDVPLPDECIECNTSATISSELRSQVSQYCVELGPLVGEVKVSWQVIELEQSNQFQVDCIYDGTTHTSGMTSTSGFLTFQKEYNVPSTAVINLTNQAELKSIIQITVECPVPTELKIVEVVITNDIDSGKYLHVEYGYTKQSYVSPVTSNLFQFQSGNNPLVSRYNILSGYQGTGSIPVNGSTVMMGTNKINFDTFDVNPQTNKFRWLRSNTLYNNNSTDITSLLAASESITINGTSPSYYANFVLPSTTFEYLYLIWDLRDINMIDLCYSTLSTFDACCGCIECFEPCYYYTIVASSSGYVRYTECVTKTVKDEYIMGSYELYSNAIGLYASVEDESTFESCAIGVFENLFIYELCSMTTPTVISGESITIMSPAECGCPA